MGNRPLKGLFAAIGRRFGVPGRLYSLIDIDRGHHRVTYRGRPALKCPFDYVLYQMILHEVSPDLVIEVGTHHGGSALYLADLMNASGKGELHTIDLGPTAEPLVHPRIKAFTGGWQKYDLALAKGFGKVLVIEDSSHHYDNTLAVMEKFAPAVTPGSYLIVEDGVVDALGLVRGFGGGPLKAIAEFLPRHPEFAIDRRWCDFFGRNATFNVDGYLRKLR